MHNDMTPKTWEEHKVAVIDVEDLTGYKFFSEAPKHLIETLKKKAPEEARRFGPAPFLAQFPGQIWLVRSSLGAMPTALRGHGTTCKSENPMRFACSPNGAQCDSPGR